MSEHRPSFVAIAHDFTRHPKVLKLGAVGARWTWLGVLCYCVEYRTNGHVPANVGEVVSGASRAFLERAREAGLLDLVDGELYVHDYEEFNGDKRARLLARERKRRQRAREKERDTDVTIGHETVTLSRAGVPSPSPTKDVTAPKDGRTGAPPAAAESRDADELEPDEAGAVDDGDAATLPTWGPIGGAPGTSGRRTLGGWDE